MFILKILTLPLSWKNMNQILFLKDINVWRCATFYKIQGLSIFSYEGLGKKTRNLVPTQNALHFWSHLASSLLLKRSLRSQNCKLLIFRQNLKSQRPGQGSYNTSQRNCCRKGGGKIRSNEEIFFAKMTVMWCHEFSFFQWWCLSEAWLIFDICGIFGQKCRSEVLSFCLLSMSIFLEQGAWILFFLT